MNKIEKRISAVEIDQRKQIVRLFFSGQKTNQLIALGCCEGLSMDKKQLVIEYIAKDWNTVDIVKMIKKGALEQGETEYWTSTFYDIDILGLRYVLFKNGNCCYVFIHQKTSKIIHCWKKNEDVTQFIESTKREFVNYILEQLGIT